MPSSYTSRLRLELQADGENANTWGQILNNNVLALADFAIAGVASIALTNATVTLTASDGAADQARAAILVLHGTLTSSVAVVVPSVTKPYLVHNNTSGAFTVHVKTAGATGAQVPQGAVTQLICDSASIRADRTSIGDLLITATSLVASNLRVTNGEIGFTSVIGAGSYSLPQLSVNGFGQITSISDGIASATEVEAAVSINKAVQPGTLHRHPAAAKAYCAWTVSAAVVSIQAQYNVTTVQRNATGDFTIFYANDMASIGHTVLCNGSGGFYIQVSRDSGSIRLHTFSTGGIQFDFAINNMVAFGDQ